MYTTALDSLPLWAVFVAELLFGWLALEFGYRLGRWRHSHCADEKDTPVGATVAAILGLVAFILAFTFGLAASRFDARRQTVVDEANAIGTTYLRARLLPEPQRAEVQKLLRDYVDVRVRAIAEHKVAELTAAERLHEQIWQQAAAAAEKDPHSVTTGLFIQSLDQMIGVHSQRLFAELRNRVPAIIWAGLFSLSALGIASMGYQAGLSATRRSPAMFALVIAFVGVLYLIVDLDRSGEGFLQVDQSAMTSLQKSVGTGDIP